MRILLKKTILLVAVAASMPSWMFGGAAASNEKTDEYQAMTSSSSSSSLTSAAVTQPAQTQQTEKTTSSAESFSYAPPQPPPTLDIAIAGAGLAVTTEWAVLSQSKVSFYSGDSTLGAARVCQADGTYNIGSMARPFRPSEALPMDNPHNNNQKNNENDNNDDSSPYLFQCVNSPVQVLQVDVALDALVMIVSSAQEEEEEAVAAQCLQASGGGWKLSQLAKIAEYYFFPPEDSSSSAEQQQRLPPPQWSDLHASCAPQNVTLKFAKLEKYGDLFTRRILGRTDWSWVDNYQRDDSLQSSMSVYSIHAVLEALQNDGGNTILGVVPYRDYIRLAEEDKKSVKVVAIADDATTGNLIVPSAETIRLESYPLVRRIQLNLRRNVVDELAKTLPFVQFGFSDIGWQAVESKGFVSLTEADRIRMLNRLATVDGGALEEDIMGPQN